MDEFPLALSPSGMETLPDHAIRVWAIDLGTTNSTVTELVWDPARGGGPECNTLDLEQPTTQGPYTGPLVPSVLAVAPGGEVWVGEGAKRLRSRPQEANLVPFKTLFYETKNDMGLKRRYPLADEAYDHASKIAAVLLRFLIESAERVTRATPDRIVVTIPASFQLNQRQDTLDAALAAGIELGDYDLLDEPTAALLDSLMADGDEAFRTGNRSRVVVFDFGGGTCDVSIVETEVDAQTRQVTASQRMASRYHRLGGGDLDAAIVHEVLLPQLLRENEVEPLELSWAEKKRVLEPQLLGTAEALKTALCKETDRLKKFERYEDERSELSARQPAITCLLGSRELVLSRPELSAREWESILEDYLDPDVLYQRDTEFRLIQSVYAPLDDALTRAGLTADEIDRVLIVGGSGRIPQVREAITAYFPKARVTSPPDDPTAQLTVGRGAAWHAFFLQAAGRPFLQPVASESIALLTEGGTAVSLVRAGSSIPFPGEGKLARHNGLAVPATGVHELEMEIVALPDRRPIFHDRWRVPFFASAGDRITIDYSISANQAFTLRAYLAEHPEEVFERTVENPLVSGASPGEARLRIEELEEALRTTGGRGVDDVANFEELARAYAELGQYERAVQHVRTALRLTGSPDATLLTLQGVYYGDLGDWAREEKAYRSADEATQRWGGPMFNLALSFWNQSRYEDALAAARRAAEKQPSGPSHTLEAQCLIALDRPEEADSALREARGRFGPVEANSDWELGWLETCARLSKDDELLEAAQEERKRRRGGLTPSAEDDDGLRPMLVGALARRDG